jgi:hypothetical protein
MRRRGEPTNGSTRHHHTRKLSRQMSVPQFRRSADGERPRGRVRGYLIRSAQVLVAIAVVALIALYATCYFSSWQERALTTRLPNADRIEVETLVVHFEQITKVVATHELTGEQAQKLMRIWHTQSYVFTGDVMCHQPAYRLRFFRNNELLTEATICFHCHNIYFYKIHGANLSDERQVIFGSALDLAEDRPPSPELHTFLDNLFPDPKDKSVYHQL